MMGVSTIVNIKTILRNRLLPGILCIVIAACSAWPAVSMPTSLSMTATTTPMKIPPTATPIHSPVPDEDGFPPHFWCESRELCITWFIGLGTGTSPAQIDAEEEVVRDFYASQSEIELYPVLVPFIGARDALDDAIASDQGPDIIGPVSISSDLHDLKDEWADLAPLIAANHFDTSVYNPNLLANYNTAQGQIALPILVYPSAIFYNTRIFDKAGLEYPPFEYGPNLGPATYRLDGQELEWNWDTVREVARRLTLDANGRNATQASFDRNKIVQYGFSWNFQAQPAYIGTYWGNGSYSADGTTAQIPDVWKASWTWTYEGMWGDQAFIPTGPISASAAFDKGNPNGSTFNSGKVAMTDQPSWYMCCLDHNKTWDVGVLPAYQGRVAGRVDADVMSIWKGTKHSDEAFRALAYLLTTGSQKLSPVYDIEAVPVRAENQEPWLDARKAKFPWVQHWEVFITNLNFPDSPNAETWIPNHDEAWKRGEAFYKRLAETSGLDIEAEIAVFQADLQAIFDRAP